MKTNLQNLYILKLLGLIFVGISFLTVSSTYASDLLVAENGGTIKRYNGQTGEFIGNFVDLSELNYDNAGECPFTPFYLEDLTYGLDLNLYVSTANGECGVLRFNGQTGKFIDRFILGQWMGIVFGPDGNFYASSIPIDTVVKYDGRTGEIIGAAIPPGSAGLTFPIDLAFALDESLYVSQFAGSVLHYDRSGNFINELSASPYIMGSRFPLTGPGLAIGPDGNLYVGTGDNSILRYNGQSGEFIDEFVPPGTGGLKDPSALVFGPDGNLYVCSSGTHNVLRFNGSTGAYIGEFVQSLSGELSYPVGLVFMEKTEGALSIELPNGGEVWNEKSKQTISWTSSNVDSNKRIQIYLSIDNGQNWKKIASSKNVGSKTWKIPKKRYISKEALIKICLKQTEPICDTSDAVFTINQTPVSEAGFKQTVTVETQVTLNGSASYDPDSGPSSITYHWMQTQGSIVALNDANTSTPSFTPAVKGTYKFGLIVNDGSADSKMDKVKVRVKTAP
jgi:hypothetical protein